MLHLRFRTASDSAIYNKMVDQCYVTHKFASLNQTGAFCGMFCQFQEKAKFLFSLH